MHDAQSSDRSREVFGFSVYDQPLERLIEGLCDAIEDRSRTTVFATLNQRCATLARSSLAYRVALLNADYLVADGVGVIWASALAGKSISQRLPGPDVSVELLASLSRRDRRYSCYFLGATEETLELLESAVRRISPNMEVAGSHSPPFRPQFSVEDCREDAKRINASGADLLLVGLGAPKQELWAERARPFLTTPLVMSVGAAFDFIAGTKPRAPLWVRQLGLEWAHRLVSEPRRMWQRYLVHGLEFALMTMSETVAERGRSLATS
ncbi:MAG: WecB/TagA/CpsF family glycosyltransferase [Myxococcales bacterium]|nr:WecB/TagA/CpsF family glycosyltransferase [Myxococcales bacterium]